MGAKSKVLSLWYRIAALWYMTVVSDVSYFYADYIPCRTTVRSSVMIWHQNMIFQNKKVHLKQKKW